MYPLENPQLLRARCSRRSSLAHPRLDSTVRRKEPAAWFSPALMLAFTAIVCGSLGFSVQRPSRATPKPKGSCSQPDAASVTGPGTGGDGVSAVSHWPGLQRTCIMNAASQHTTCLFLLFQLRASKQGWHVYNRQLCKGIWTTSSGAAPSTPSGEGPHPDMHGPFTSGEEPGTEGQPKEVVGDAAHGASTVPSCTDSSRSESCLLETSVPEARQESPFHLNTQMYTQGG